MPLGVMLLVIFYRLPHNVLGVHTELCLILDLLVYGFIVLAGVVSQSAANNKQKKRSKMSTTQLTKKGLFVM
jgi:L-asparagine transporter-like permease